MNLLKNFLNGFESALGDIGSRRDYQLPKRGDGFAQDARNIAGDWYAVPGDMRRAVNHVKNEYRVR